MRRMVLQIVSACLLGGAAAGPGTAQVRLQIEPNAIQNPARPMSIEVSGIQAGATVRLSVIRDCNADGEPDLTGTQQCKSPLLERDSRAATGDQVVRDQLDFRALAAAGTPLPRDTPLWLRASRGGSVLATSAVFGLVENPCTLWQSVVDTFLRGRCNPGLSQALRRHLGPAGLDGFTFEVRRLNPAAAAPTATPVAGTRGATGVGWLAPQSLLVTVAPTVGSGERIRPGLWRVPVERGAPELLWEPAPGDERMAAAPLALSRGRIAFVRQRLGEAAGPGTEPAAWLTVWSQGKIEAEMELPHKIHQLLAADAGGRSILALTLGLGANHPAFLLIDLGARTVRDLGYDHALYHAALRSPSGSDAAVAIEDNSGRNGWDLLLVNGQGEWKADLQARPALHDLLPVWRPDGGEIAFLAEVERTAPQP